MTPRSECYRLYQQVVVARDIFCRYPGCGQRSTVAHHIFKRDRLATAFNPKYGIGLCAGHHGNWAHAQPTAFKSWLVSIMGEDGYYEGLRLSNTQVKHIDFNTIRESLLLELAKYSRS